MYEKILVPIDGSKRGERVLHHVEKLAIANNSEVDLLMVAQLKDRTPSEQNSQYYLDSMERQKVQAESYLTAIRIALKNKNVKTKGSVIFGDVIKSILEYAEQEKPDLIAVSSHGHKSFRSLANKTTRPVLIISS